MEKYIINRILRKMENIDIELMDMHRAFRKGEDIDYRLLSLERELTAWLACLSCPSTVDSPKLSENSVSQLLDIAGKIISGIDKDSLYAFPLSFVGDDSESVKGYRVKVDISVVKDKGKKRFLF